MMNEEYDETLEDQVNRIRFAMDEIETSEYLPKEYWIPVFQAVLGWMNQIQEMSNELHNHRYEMVMRKNEGFTRDGILGGDLQSRIWCMNYIVNTLKDHGLDCTQTCLNENIRKVYETTEEFKRTKDLGAGI
jgi:hypothetical protein